MLWDAPGGWHSTAKYQSKAVSYRRRARARAGQNRAPCAFFLHFHLLMRPFPHLGEGVAGRFPPRFPFFDAQEVAGRGRFVPDA